MPKATKRAAKASQPVEVPANPSQDPVYEKIQEAESVLRRAKERLETEVAARRRIELELGSIQKSTARILAQMGDQAPGSTRGRSRQRTREGAGHDLLEYLRRTKDQLSSILHGIGEGVMVRDSTGQLVYANAAAARILGCATTQALLETLPGEVLSRVTVTDEQGRPFPSNLLTGPPAVEAAQGPGITARFTVRATGSAQVAIVRSTNVYDDMGEVRFQVSVFTDITELKRTQEALDREYRKAAQRVTRLDTMAHGLFSIGLMPFTEATQRVTDVALHVTGVSQAAFYPFDEASGRFAQATVDPISGAPGLRGLDLTQLFGGKSSETSASSRQSVYCPDSLKDERWGALLPGVRAFYATAVSFSDHLFGALLLLSGHVDGIPEEERFMADTVAAYGGTILENARLYQQVQALAAGSERTRISHELHDGLAQVLGYVNAQAQAVEVLLDKQEMEEGRVQLRALIQAARKAYQDVRQGMMDLRSQAGSGRMFQDILEEYLTTYKRRWGQGMELLYQIPPEVALLSPSQEVQILRVIQEALSNARRHAHATRLEVRMECSGGRLKVEVKDNGLGFAPDAVPKVGLPRLGLTTMRERAAALAGTLEIRSAPGEGTTVLLLAPVADPISRMEVRQ